MTIRPLASPRSGVSVPRATGVQVRSAASVSFARATGTSRSPTRPGPLADGTMSFSVCGPLASAAGCASGRSAASTCSATTRSRRCSHRWPSGSTPSASTTRAIPATSRGSTSRRCNRRRRHRRPAESPRSERLRRREGHRQRPRGQPHRIGLVLRVPADGVVVRAPTPGRLVRRRERGARQLAPPRTRRRSRGPLSVKVR